MRRLFLSGGKARWRSATARLTVTGLSLLSLLVVLPQQSASALPLEQHRPATYNLQGNGGGSKWNTSIRQLMAGDGSPQSLYNNDLLALQESGSPPAGAVPTDRRVQATDGGITFTVTEYEWNVGTSSRPVTYYIYFLPQPGAGNDRTSMAIVTHGRADEMNVIPNRGTGTRGSVGVRYNNTWFYDIHAASAGPSRARRDALDLITQIQHSVAQTPFDWVALGDFNVDLFSNVFSEQRGMYTYAPTEVTQQSGGQLDFMVTNRHIDGYGAHRINGMDSDHFPVAFRPNMVASAPQGAGWNLNTSTGQSVDVWQANPGQQAGLNRTYAPGTNPHQEFRYDEVPGNPEYGTLRNSYNGMCLAVANSTSGAPVVSEPCDPTNPEEWFTRWASSPNEWITDFDRTISYDANGLIALSGSYLALAPTAHAE
ncbi:endonuclease/exonuclease/phosphatase family protein [Streptantibioticus ferralitis]|uniref:Endonuclease/exonuclease/phosphatase family protein n=1 Tax=Streptantibioticus ferralitis TaxID=236510 RepID=A0ABT5Z8P1_9ACTN|nr:endonuclease/exonuclease/phosphatase family protein [Streptantibioticus ferralitis]MDF2260198.1 endonuclease/exonuclease/phosphatase family protein [Streptantibioticus ferralitis]